MHVSAWHHTDALTTALFGETVLSWPQAYAAMKEVGCPLLLLLEACLAS